MHAAKSTGLEAQNMAPGDSDALNAGGLAFYPRGENAAANRSLEAFLQHGPEFEVGTEVKAMLAAMDEQLAFAARALVFRDAVEIAADHRRDHVKQFGAFDLKRPADLMSEDSADEMEIFCGTKLSQVVASGYLLEDLGSRGDR